MHLNSFKLIPLMFLLTGCAMYLASTGFDDVVKKGMSEDEFYQAIRNPSYPALSNPSSTKRFINGSDTLKLLFYNVFDRQSVANGYPTVDHIEYVAFKNGHVFEWGEGTSPSYSFSQVSISTPENWPTIQISEQEVRNMFDSKDGGISAIEGIWNVSEGGSWKDLETDAQGEFDDRIRYRLAIAHDQSDSTYDYVAHVIESDNLQWKPGMVKAKFRNSAYEHMWECLWFLADFKESHTYFAMNDLGLVTTTRKSYDVLRPEIERSITTTLIKAYPSTFRPSQSDTTHRTTGSGFLLSSDGIVVTNYHVIDGAKNIEIVFPLKNLVKRARIILKDVKNDIVLLNLVDFKMSDLSNMDIPYSIASSSSVKVGQSVFTLGFPLGEILGSHARLSTGNVNSEFGLQDDPRLFQISNPLQPGNSGGPLFNQNGELIGIVVSGLNAKYFYENIGIIPQNVNFAIKSDYIRSLVSMIESGDDIIKRINLVATGPLESIVKQIEPFTVQVRTY